MMTRIRADIPARTGSLWVDKFVFSTEWYPLFVNVGQDGIILPQRNLRRKMEKILEGASRGEKGELGKQQGNS